MIKSKAQERLVFVARHIGILPYGFNGNAAHFDLEEHLKEELMDVAISYGLDKYESFEDMFMDLLYPLGYAIGHSCVIYKYHDECYKYDYEFITVRKGYEQLSTIKPEKEWSYSQQYRPPRCGLCDKRNRCEFFKSGLHMPKSII